LKDKLSTEISKIFKNYLKEKYNLELLVFAEEPPNLKFGDICFSFPLKISRDLKEKPFEIAKKISNELSDLFFPHKLFPASPGYINIFFDKNYFVNSLKDFEEEKERKKEKIIVEHTNINPNKAAHIGHLRNAILGDTIVNFYRHLNYNVEVHNYIDNTGVQVADVVLGLLYLEKKGLEFLDIEKLDYYTWDLYSKVSKIIEEDKSYLNLRNEILKKIEEGIEPEKSYAKKLSEKMMLCHLKTMERLDIKYDVLPKESEILNSKLWDKTFSLLKEKKAILFEEEGKRKGCWVLPLKGKEEFKTEEEPDKILVRSNGTVTYTGKDIAYQLWKFGILKASFGFKPFYKYKDGKIVYESTSEKSENDFPFGNGDVVINVIDIRQSYLQKVVKEALKLLGYDKESENSIHFSYEMVVLSEKLAKQMGFEELKISGRKGVGIKADDFIDSLIEKAKEEIQKRSSEKDIKEIDEISKKIAIGALKIFILKFGKEKVIFFDFDEALNFDGDTGPYLQYAIVRINSLIKKLKEEGKTLQVSFPINSIEDDLWKYLMLCENFDFKIEKSIKNLDPSIFVYYLLDLAKNFHIFYTENPFLKEENKEIYNKRLFILYQFQKALKKGLELLNIPIPEKM